MCDKVGIMPERKFAIVTDSSCDFPEDYYREHGVACVKLGFMMDGVVYEGEDGQSIDIKRFYQALRGGSMPTTFQISAEQAKHAIEPLVKEGKDVLVVAFSSGLSGTAGSFAVAARELSEQYKGRKILVVDSLCASLGEGLFVDYIVKKADTGASIEETRDYAEGLKQHICHVFTVDNLFHLKRGGRVSAATAVVGSILKIKPVLHVDEKGHLIPIGKEMGRKKSISALVDRMKELSTLEADDPIFISHGDCMEDVEFLIKLIREQFGDRTFYVHYVGSVIGTHSGAGTLALFFRGKHR